MSKYQYINKGKSYLKYVEEKDYILVEKLFVTPSKRGKKLGYELMRTLIQTHKNKHIQLFAIAFEDDETNYNNKHWLIKYYRNFGFKSIRTDIQEMNLRKT